jgi:ESCRT-I complex subunit TSG101
MPIVTTPPPNLLEEEAPDVRSSILAEITSPPPRPPNPELLKLHGEVLVMFRSQLAALASEIELIRAQQPDLLAAEPAIRDEMARLEAVRDVCRTVAGRMRGTVDQAERNIAELKRKGDPEVDELVCATSIVHNQYVTQQRALRQITQSR